MRSNQAQVKKAKVDALNRRIKAAAVKFLKAKKAQDKAELALDVATRKAEAAEYKAYEASEKVQDLQYLALELGAANPIPVGKNRWLYRDTWIEKVGKFYFTWGAGRRAEATSMKALIAKINAK
jgi:hypothetical protein